MRVGIERVVDRNAVARTETAIGSDHARTAAVREHEVIARNQCEKWIVRIFGNAFERSRRVDIPENHAATFIAKCEHFAFEERIADADTARLDDDIGAARTLQCFHRPGFAAGIDDDVGPRRRIDVAMVLAIQRVGFVKGDAMSARIQCANDAAIVGRRAVPV